MDAELVPVDLTDLDQPQWTPPDQYEAEGLWFELVVLAMPIALLVAIALRGA